MNAEYGSDTQLLANYVAGECSPEQRLAVERLIAADPEAAATLNRMQRAVHAIPLRERDRVVDAVWAGVQEHLSRPKTSLRQTMRGFPALGRQTLREGPLDSRPSLVGPRRWGRIGLWAAAALAVVLIMRGPYRHVSTERTYTTLTGQRSRIVLRDGSRVILAPQSVLVISPTFGADDRMVMLTGEASFDVVNVAANNMPFVVRTGAIATRVLGTSFTVRHYAGDSTVQIVVVAGKVMTGPPRRTPLTLAVGDMAQITDSTATTTRLPDVRVYTAWTDGRLVFRDAPVLQVLATLERWYGLTFRLTDSTLAHRHVNAALDYGSTTGLMKALRVLLDVTPTFDGTTIVLSPNRSMIWPARVRSDADTLFTHTGEKGR